MTTKGILNYYESPADEEIQEIIYKAYLYTSGLTSLDITDPWAIQAASEFSDIHMKYLIATAFEAPEIMEMPLKKRIELFSDKRLEPYAYCSRAYTDPDKVVLSEEAEKARTLMRSACNNEKTRNILDHAVHCELSRENQNMYNNHPNSFTGEVASLSNELTFVKYRYENAETEAEKLYWLDQIIYLFYDELFHKILLSEFEDYCYKIIEKGGSLDADDMADKWLALHREYYGKPVTISDDLGIDWAWLPHFYTNYYVYQYATSLTYAAAVCRRVEKADSPKEKRKAVNAYLDFLKSGNSADPASLIKIAGVDILGDKTYEAAGEYISGLIDEFVKMAGAVKL